MILDTLKNSNLYTAMHPAFEQAFSFLYKIQNTDPEPGKYEINGDRIYAVASKYQPGDKNYKWEAHKKYIDIHYIIKGSEILGWQSADMISEEASYDEKNDCALYDSIEGLNIELKSGYFSIFYPNDIHCPGFDFNSEDVTKIVIKVKI